MGQQFAIIEMKTVVSMVYKKFTFRNDRLKPPQINCAITMTPTKGIYMFPQKREDISP